MKKRATWKSCCILMSVAIAIAPVIYAADQEPIRTARAIGEEETTPPTAPKKTTTPTAPKETPAVKPGEVATESEVSNTAIWAGAGIAFLLAVSGGSSGGGSSAPPHPNPTQ